LIGNELHIHVAHSPDPDDRLMFWPLADGLVESARNGRSYLFSFEEADTQALNRIASEGRADVCAVSAIHALRLMESHQPLIMGASVGDAYGPVVVALKGGSGEKLWIAGGPEARKSGLHLLTPGETTTAHTVAQLVGLTFADCEAVPIVPLTRVFDHLKECEAAGRPTVALLIHEGRLTFADHGCVRLMDIGELWTQQTGVSLPLGLNVVSRSLPLRVRQDISDIFVESCSYAVNHREQFVRMAQIPNHTYHSALSGPQLRHYLDLYANQTTVSILERDKQGFQELLRRAAASGYLNLKNQTANIDWI
jgi:1,4-dihydroxy-6-naphthoate synthase